MGIRLSRSLGKPIEKPPHFSKGKSEGVERIIFYFSRSFLSLERIFRLRSLIVFCGMPEAFDHSRSDNPRKKMAFTKLCSSSDNKEMAKRSLSNIILRTTVSATFTASSAINSKPLPLSSALSIASKDSRLLSASSFCR